MYNSEAFIDPFPVAALQERYRSKKGEPLKSSALNNRLKFLGIKSFPQEGQGSSRFVHAADVERLDALDAYIHETGTMQGFPGSEGEMDIATSDPQPTLVPKKKSKSPAGAIAKLLPFSREDVDSPSLWNLVTKTPARDAIGHLLKPIQEFFYPKHRKAIKVIELLEIAASTNTSLPTSVLADCFDCSTSFFSGKSTVSRMGYTLTKAGKDGRESVWKVTRPQTPIEGTPSLA